MNLRHDLLASEGIVGVLGTCMSDQLFALRLFTEVARTGSFSRGARELKLSQPTASRIIAELERNIGASLFVRTTRALTLTEAGQDYLPRVRSILDALEEADHAARGTGELRGTVRVGVSSSFAVRALVPRLPTFAAAHPALCIDLVIDDHNQDLIGESIDVALRFGRLPDSSALTRRIGAWPLIVAAAPSYLERAGVPSEPTDLASHSAILFGACNDTTWAFHKAGRKTTVRIAGRIKTSSSNTAMAATVAGLGIYCAIEPSFRRELSESALVRLLPDWEMNTLEVHALYPGAQAPKPSARAFVDFLETSLRDF